MEEKAFKHVTRAELDILMVHLVRSMPVLTLAVGKLKINDFDEVTERGHQLIWGIVMDFYSDHKVLIPESILHAEIDSWTVNSPGYFTEEMKVALHGQVRGIFAVPQHDMIDSYALNVLSSLLFQRRVEPQLAAAIQQRGDVKAMLNKIQTETTACEVSRAGFIEPFADTSEPALAITPKQSTGIPFMDALLNGGVKPKETYGLIAPSSGGKTTLSNQLAIAYASQGLHTYVFSYEEAVDDDYLIPVYACAARIPRQKLEKGIKSLDELDQVERDGFLNARKLLKSHLHYVDMSGKYKNGNGGVEEIDSYLTVARDSGKAASCYIVDWFLPLLKRRQPTWELARGQHWEDRSFAQTLIDQLKQLSTRHCCWGWINHQTAPAQSTKTRVLEWTDAAEFKSFSWYLNACFALSTLDNNNIGSLKISKSRRTEKTHQVVRLDGTYATFVAMGPDYSWNSKERGYCKPGDEKKVPGANEPPKNPVTDDYAGAKGVMQ